VASFWNDPEKALSIILRCLVQNEITNLFKIQGVDQRFSVAKFVLLHRRGYARRNKHGVPHEIRHLETELCERLSSSGGKAGVPARCKSLGGLDGDDTSTMDGYRYPTTHPR